MDRLELTAVDADWDSSDSSHCITRVICS
jgi:hypothetical protein